VKRRDALLALGAGTLGIGHAQDLAREQRWADEILPTILVGDPVRIRAGSGHEFLGLYTPVTGARIAVVLAHGVGVHPDHGVIGALRTRLSDLGHSTLSIQMPVAAKEAAVDDYYPRLFPAAADRLARAAAWLRERTPAIPVLLSHSMGAWMANEYLDGAFATTPYKAWIAMGVTGGFSWTMRRFPFPILDLYGENDLDAVRRAADRRRWALQSANGSRQVMIPAADHFYAGQEAALASAIDGFMRSLLPR
jgi:pimeloyl-ACP methyl ester carboxylesterase